MQRPRHAVHSFMDGSIQGAPGMLPCMPTGMAPCMPMGFQMAPTGFQMVGLQPGTMPGMAADPRAQIAMATMGAPAIDGQLQQVMMQQFGQPVLTPQMMPSLPQTLPPQGLTQQPLLPQGLPQQSLPSQGLPQPLPPQGVPPPPASLQPALMTPQYQLTAAGQLAQAQQLGQLAQAQGQLMQMHSFEQASQAYEQLTNATPEPEVADLAQHFKLDERIMKDLDVQIKKRKGTIDDDIKALYEILEGARNPAGLLRVKIREMEEGTFRGTLTPDRDIEDLSRKLGLDVQASAKLAEVLSKREDRKRDLRQIAKHLELSNKPSSLVMLMLKDLRAGNQIKDPEFPAAVGSYAHKRAGKAGKGGGRRSRSRSRRRRRSSSSSPPSEFLRRQAAKANGPDEDGADAGGSSVCALQGSASGSRPMTLLERFG